jgi:hypothetical protein
MLSPGNLWRMVWINLRHGKASPNGTRLEPAAEPTGQRLAA